MLRGFGKSSGEEVNLFTYDKIYWSGIFNRAYIYELENGEIKPGDVETMETFSSKNIRLLQLRTSGCVTIKSSRNISSQKQKDNFI